MQHKVRKRTNLRLSYEEWAQELGLTRYQLLLKSGSQLKELSERKAQRTFEEVNSAALVAQRKAEEDFARVRMMAVQRKKYPIFDGSSTCPTA